MQTVLARPSAEIVQFTARASLANRLTLMDRIQAMEWAAANAAPAGARLIIHNRQSDDAPEITDYIGIYRAAERWATWGVARLGALVTVWNGSTGSDVGLFNCMKDALAAVSSASLHARRPR